VEAILNIALIWLWSSGIALGDWTGESCKGGFDVTPMAAALTGALISGVGMYAIGTHAQDRFAMSPAMAGNPAMTYYTAAPQPVGQRTVAAPRQTVYRAASAAPAVYRNADVKPRRSITKTALIIGGSAASGAGVGGIVGGKKGALLGAAIGGGAASIYEATRR
jgi:hypothetical protein